MGFDWQPVWIERVGLQNCLGYRVANNGTFSTGRQKLAVSFLISGRPPIVYDGMELRSRAGKLYIVVRPRTSPRPLYGTEDLYDD